MNSENFIDQLRILAALPRGLETDRVLEAFKAVPRENFAGLGPWKVWSPHEGFTLPIQETPDADPKWLYNAVLIVLDESRGINIGDPGFWSRLLRCANVKPGARILQVGAGVGYYTAILSHLAGREGHVLAYEVERELVERASANLTTYSNVEVRHGNAATDLEGDDQFDLVIAFAGVTHVPEAWSSRLAPGGHLLLPLTGTDWWGAMILASKSDQGFDAVTLGRCAVYPCAGIRDDALAMTITELFADPSLLSDRRLKIDRGSGQVRIEQEIV